MLEVFLRRNKVKKLTHVLLVLSSFSPATTECPAELSLISGTTSKAIWISENTENPVASKPPCFDNTSALITRNCSNGVWNPTIPPLCAKISDTSSTNFFVEILPTTPSSVDNYENSTIFNDFQSTSKLVLSFEERKHALYLLVYNPKGLLGHKKKMPIFCFTDADKTTLKKQSDMYLVFNHSESDPDFPIGLLVYEVEIEKYMGEYWCEAFTRNLFLVKSDIVIAYEKKRGNEYALRLLISKVCKLSPCDLEHLFKYLTKKLKERFKEFNAEVRVMEIFQFDIYNDVLDILFHVSTGRNFNVIIEYHELLRKIESLRRVDIIAIDFRSSEFCLPERTRLNHWELEWPLAKINSLIVPKQFCFNNDGTPVVRQCQGSFLYGAFWSNVTGECMDNPPISTVTAELRDIATSFYGSVEDVWNRIKDANLTVLDIYYLDVILEKFPDNQYALDFADKLMITDDETLKKSQNVLNLADTTLDIIESIVTNLTSDPDSVYCIQKENLIVHITNPFQSNISGMLLYNNHIQDFQRGNSFDDIDKTELELALYVPEMILEQILNETNNSVSDVVIITVIFYNDHFFIDENYHSGSFVVSVSIPGYGTYLKSPIPILFRSKDQHNQSNTCGFWDNGKRTHWKKGTWSALGSNYVQNYTNNLHECSFIHLTHFALLVMSDKKIMHEGDNEAQEVSFEDVNEYILEILTIVGCLFSGVGILGIFLTAFLYHTWRKRIGTKILLNLSIAILLEIICIHLSEIRFLKTSGYFCKIVGMTLHYVVLSKFFWMLVYAWLQYYRFVKVIGSIPKNLILKSVIFGWGVPLAWVAIVGIINTESYVSRSYELCYPRGVFLYATVLVPIFITMIINIIVFCLIMYNTAQLNKSSSGGKNNLFRLRLYLGLLLFSVLGIPWVFGLLAEILPQSTLKIVLFYAFCITATLQGFVLFLFYVVLNKETREFWIRNLRSKK